jgi:hypothetical protein
MCPKNGCKIDLGMSPEQLAKWITNATGVEPSHPEDLGVAKASHGHVVVLGPPGKPGFIAEYFVGANMRARDAMRGFLAALWSKNDVKAALNAVEFLESLFGDACCESGKLPMALRIPAITDIRKLKSQLSDPSVKLREVLEEYATASDIHRLPDSYNNFPTLKSGSAGVPLLIPGDKHAFRTCTTFTCSLWTFLHLTAASAAYMAAANHSHLSPEKVMNFAHHFVSEFLTCAACRRHFLASYNNCEFGRCNLDKQTDWNGLVLWLWRVHQGVSLRVAAQNNAPVDRRWPPYEDCPGCWQPRTFEAGDDSSKVGLLDVEKIGSHSHQIDVPFNLTNVYNFIVQSYVGQDAASVTSKEVLLQLNSDVPAVQASTGSRKWIWCTALSFSLIGVIVLISSLWCIRSRQHMEDDSEEDLETEGPMLSDCE